jgi:hypothetical protein
MSAVSIRHVTNAIVLAGSLDEARLIGEIIAFFAAVGLKNQISTLKKTR